MNHNLQGVFYQRAFTIRSLWKIAPALLPVFLPFVQRLWYCAFDSALVDAALAHAHYSQHFGIREKLFPGRGGGAVGGTGTIYATSNGERKQPYIPDLDSAKVIRIVST